MQYIGGEILHEFANGVFERPPLHLFLYLLLFKRKTIQTRTLLVLNCRGVKLYCGKVHEMLKRLSFFLILFSLYYIFYYGKLCMLGNFAGWRHERGCTRYVEYLPNGTYQSLNKDARVRLYIHKAKLCTLFCLAPCASVSLLDKGGLYEC